MKSAIQIIFFLLLVPTFYIEAQSFNIGKDTIINENSLSTETSIFIENNFQLKTYHSKKGDLKESFEIIFDSSSEFHHHTGTFIQYYDNNNIEMIRYLYKGKSIGTHHLFHQSGQLFLIENWPSDSTLYLLPCDSFFIDLSEKSLELSLGFSTVYTSLPHGKWTQYWANGKIKSEKYFDKGLEVGIWKWYHFNGLPKMMGSYFQDDILEFPGSVEVCKDIYLEDQELYLMSYDFPFPHIRKRHGKWLEWYEDGRIKSIMIYDKGKLIKKNTFYI